LNHTLWIHETHKNKRTSSGEPSFFRCDLCIT
jgi:hypothetical protein